MAIVTYGTAPRYWIVGIPAEISDYLNLHPGLIVESTIPVGSLTLLGIPSSNIVCLVRQ